MICANRITLTHQKKRNQQLANEPSVTERLNKMDAYVLHKKKFKTKPVHMILTVWISCCCCCCCFFWRVNRLSKRADTHIHIEWLIFELNSIFFCLCLWKLNHTTRWNRIEIEEERKKKKQKYTKRSKLEKYERARHRVRTCVQCDDDHFICLFLITLQLSTNHDKRYTHVLNTLVYLDTKIYL